MVACAPELLCRSSLLQVLSLSFEAWNRKFAARPSGACPAARSLKLIAPSVSVPASKRNQRLSGGATAATNIDF